MMVRPVALARSLLLSASLLTSAHAVGQPPADEAADSGDRVAKASALYDHGKKAHARGDYAAAARYFARADALVPDSSALAAALVAVLKTDHAALGMSLSGRTAREPFNERLMALAEQARARFAARAGRIVVHCEACVVRIDGEAAPRGVATWLAVGEHHVVIRLDDREEHRAVTVAPAEVVTLVPSKPSAPNPGPPPPPEPVGEDESSAGGSQAWFWVSLALTAGVGAGAIASGVDTAAKHDEFAQAPTDKGAIEGQTAETRTNALIGVTAGLGLITTAVGIFVVDWTGGDASAAVRVDGDGLGACLTGRF